LEIITMLLKGAAVAGALAFTIKNADILAPLAGAVGAFFHMCGLPLGGLIVRVTVAGYLLIKVFGWC